MVVVVHSLANQQVEAFHDQLITVYRVCCIIWQISRATSLVVAAREAPEYTLAQAMEA